MKYYVWRDKGKIHACNQKEFDEIKHEICETNKVVVYNTDPSLRASDSGNYTNSMSNFGCKTIHPNTTVRYAEKGGVSAIITSNKTHDSLAYEKYNISLQSMEVMDGERSYNVEPSLIIAPNTELSLGNPLLAPTHNVCEIITSMAEKRESVGFKLFDSGRNKLMPHRVMATEAVSTEEMYKYVAEEYYGGKTEVYGVDALLGSLNILGEESLSKLVESGTLRSFDISKNTEKGYDESMADIMAGNFNNVELGSIMSKCDSATASFSLSGRSRGMARRSMSYGAKRFTVESGARSGYGSDARSSSEGRRFSYRDLKPRGDITKPNNAVKFITDFDD